eukprot:bmy_20599T0
MSLKRPHQFLITGKVSHATERAPEGGLVVQGQRGCLHDQTSREGPSYPRRPLPGLDQHQRSAGSHGSEEPSGVLLSSDLLSVAQDRKTRNRSSTDATGLAPRSENTDHMIFRSITVAVALCGLVGNGIVISFVHLSAKKNAFFIYSLHLAVEDFMNLCFQTVFSVCQILKLFLHYSFHLHDTFMVLRFFFYFSGLGIMTAISFQCCLSSFFPIWYQCRCPKHLSGNVRALLWILIFSFGPALTTATTVWVLLPFSILGLSSLLFLLRVQASSQQHWPRKLYLVLLLSVLGFFLFGLPLCIVSCLVADTKHHTLSDVCIHLSCTNSTANPAIDFFIGGLQTQRLREPLKVVLQRALGEETEDGEDGKVPLTGKVETVDL